MLALERLEIHGTCRVSPRAQFHMRHGALGNVTVAWGSGVLDGKDAIVLALKQEGTESTLTLHLDELARDEEAPDAVSTRNQS